MRHNLFLFQKDKGDSPVWGGFSSVKIQLYIHQHFKNYWKFKKQKFLLAVLLKFSGNVVSLCIVGVAEVVPRMRQICLSFTNSCLLLLLQLKQPHSLGFNKVPFHHLLTEMWDADWGISKIFCDKVGTRHKKTQYLLQTVCRLILNTEGQPYFA